MNKIWMKGLEEEDCQEFKAAVKSTEGRKVVERLLAIVEEDTDKVNKSMSDATFGGDWGFEQAVLVSQLKNNLRLKDLLKSLLTNKQ